MKHLHVIHNCSTISFKRLQSLFCQRSGLCSLLVALLMVMTVNAAPTKVLPLNHHHYLTTELGLGYSSLIQKSDYGKSNGLAGGALQVGYEWNYKHFLLHSGIEFAMITDLAHLNDVEYTAPYTTGLLNPEYPMTQHYRFINYTDMEMLGQVNIPLMVGGLFQDRWFFLVGAKAGIPLLHKSTSKATLRTTLTDEFLIGEIGDRMDIPQHDIITTNESATFDFPTNINVQLAAEVGMIVKSFNTEQPKSSGAKANAQPAKQPIHLRVALFCDYGLLNLVKPSEGALVSVQEPRTAVFNPYLGNGGCKVNSLLVGVKFAALFHLNKPKTIELPQSWLDILVTDAATKAPLASTLVITDEKTGRSQTRTTKSGKLHTRTKEGDYTVEASAQDYYPQTQSYSIAELGDNASLDFALRHRPYLRVRVTNKNTNDPLMVGVQIIDRNNGDTVAIITTDSTTGVIRTMLDESRQYKVRVAQLGYETALQDVRYVGDSILLSLQPIKKGRTIVVHHLYYATNETRILPKSESALVDLSEFMRENPNIRIRIVGHTDNVGTEQANQILSQGRADALRDELVARGIEADRIETLGKGEKEPVASNDTEEGRALNRRVEFTIL